MRKIAQYIHLTDSYIYPQLYTDPLDPAWVECIGRCLGSRDNLFSAEHIHLALHQGQIVGIACVIPCGKALHFAEYADVTNIPHHRFDLVVNGYFAPLIAESQGYDGFNIINVCIDPDHQNKGVGTLLLKHCIATYGHQPIHLDVIADNQSAVQLYKNAGFAIVDTYAGFSGDDTPLPCYHMLRTPTTV